MPNTELNVVRITHRREADAYHAVLVSFTGPAARRYSYRSRFRLLFPPDFQERLRWYFEDFRSQSAEPALIWAVSIGKEIADFGSDLFSAVFGGIEGAELWHLIRDQLEHVRIEVTSTSDLGNVIPWEAMRDPDTGTVLSTRCHAFVRTTEINGKVPLMPVGPPVRVLLVIARPLREDDVPFRVVASGIMAVATHTGMDVDVLRPATLDRLRAVLTSAASAGKPYHIVHFDGHGLYEDLVGRTSGQPETSPRGYVLFETNDAADGGQPVHGTLLGEMLCDARVPCLVVNACRSARAGGQAIPDEAPEPTRESMAFPSFAQEAFAAGLYGIVAMRHDVHVDTASIFVRRLYELLSQGVGFGMSVRRARAGLAATIEQRRGVEDWLIPIAYEVQAGDEILGPFGAQATRETELDPAAGARAADGAPDCDTQNREGEIIGQDRTLLAIDRAFDTSSMFALYGCAGIGKTSVALEFSRWYKATRGIAGPVIVTSFANVSDLGAELIDVARVLGVRCETTEPQRVDSLLQTLRGNAFLWIWDGAEHLFAGRAPRRQPDDHAIVAQLRQFVRELGNSNPLRVLLTSRATLEADFPDLQFRFVDSLSFDESEELVRSVLRERGEPMAEASVWDPLVTCADGCPLVLKGLLLQALHEGRTSPSSISDFARAFSRGVPIVKHLPPSERESCIVCSLDRGPLPRLTSPERAVIALTHLHRGFVHLNSLLAMLTPGRADALQGHHVDVGIGDEAALEDALTVAADGGLLTKSSRTNYGLHPALHVYVEPWFREHFAEPDVAVRGFVVATLQTMLGAFEQIKHGDRRAVFLLVLYKSNVLRAREYAVESGLWLEALLLTEALGSAAHILNDPADVTGLYLELKPQFVNANGGAAAGAEWQWARIIKAEALAAFNERRYDAAEKLLRTVIETVSPVDRPPPLTTRDSQRMLVSCLWLLGEVYMRLRRIDAVTTLETALELCRELGQDVANAGLSLAKAYITVPAVPKTERARELAIEALRGSNHPEDRVHALTTLGQCAVLAASRAPDGGENGTRRIEALRAVEFLREAMRNSLPTKHDDLSAICHSLADAHDLLGQPGLALPYHQQALQHAMKTGDPERIVFTQRAVGAALAHTEQYQGALSYIDALPEQGETNAGAEHTKSELVNDLLARDAARLFHDANYFAERGTDEGATSAFAREATDARAQSVITACDRILESGAVERRSPVLYLKASALWRLRVGAVERDEGDKVVRLARESIELLEEGLALERRPSSLWTAMELSRADCEAAIGKAWEANNAPNALKAYRRAIRAYRLTQKGATSGEGDTRSGLQALSFALAGEARCLLAVGRIYSGERRSQQAIRAVRSAVTVTQGYVRLVGDESACDLHFNAMSRLGDLRSTEARRRNANCLRSALATFDELALFCGDTAIPLSNRKGRLANVVLRAGWVSSELGQWKRAEQDYKEALRIYLEIAEPDSETHAGIGDVYRALSNIPGTPQSVIIDYLTRATAAFANARTCVADDSALATELIARHTAAMASLAVAMRQSMPDRARRLFEEAIAATFATPAAAHETVLRARAVILKRFALFEGGRGTFAQSIPVLNECIKVIDQLAALHPSDAEIAHDKAAALMLLGQAFLVTEQGKLADETLRRAFGSIEEALRHAPKKREYRATFHEIASHFTPRPTLRDVGIT